MNINLSHVLYIKVNSKLVNHLYIKVKAIKQILKKNIRKILRLEFKIINFKMDNKRTIHQKLRHLGLYQNLTSLVYQCRAEEVQTSKNTWRKIFSSQTSDKDFYPEYKTAPKPKY